MADRCPLCRGVLDVETARCRRCGADLGLSWQAERSGDMLCAAAVTALIQGRREQARRLARRAALHRDDLFTRHLIRFLGEPGRESRRWDRHDPGVAEGPFPRG